MGAGIGDGDGVGGVKGVGKVGKGKAKSEDIPCTALFFGSVGPYSFDRIQ